MQIQFALTHLLAALAVSLCTSIPATAQDNPIASRMRAFVEAYNAGDEKAVAGFYTEDGVLLPPHAAALVGREAIGNHYASAFAAGVNNLRIDIKEIRGHGPARAVEIGETAVELNGQTIQGRYLHVWTLAGGQWFLSRDMYHVLAVR